MSERCGIIDIHVSGFNSFVILHMVVYSIARDSFRIPQTFVVTTIREYIFRCIFLPFKADIGLHSFQYDMQNAKCYSCVVNNYNSKQVTKCKSTGVDLQTPFHQPPALHVSQSFIQTIFTQGGPMRVVNSLLYGRTVYTVHKSRDTVSHAAIISKIYKAVIEI